MSLDNLNFQLTRISNLNILYLFASFKLPFLGYDKTNLPVFPNNEQKKYFWLDFIFLSSEYSKYNLTKKPLWLDIFDGKIFKVTKPASS